MNNTTDKFDLVAGCRLLKTVVAEDTLCAQDIAEADYPDVDIDIYIHPNGVRLAQEFDKGQR